MAKFKLKTTKELFPDTAKKLESEDKKMEFGRMFRISSEQKKKVVEKIDGFVEEVKRQREGVIKIKAEGVRNYEGIEASRGPWKGSSNISTMISTIASDLMHAKLFPMTWNVDSLHFEATEKHDVEGAKNNETLMRWGLTKDMENTQEKVDDILQRLVVDGTVAIKLAWEIYYTYVTRKVPDRVDSKGNIKSKVVYEKIRRERPRWLIRDIDYVYFTYNAENEQRADIVDEVYFTLPQLREMKAAGLLLPDVDLEAVKNSVEKTFDPQGTQKARYQAAGIEAFHARLDSYPIKVYEAYMGHSFDDQEARKDCIFLVLPDQKIYLAGKPLHTVSRIGRKPWIIRPFLRRPGTMWGKSVPVLVRHLHKEMNAIHNQRIDAGNMVIAPFFFYRAASGMEPKEISIRPATGIPLDDPQRDVFFPEYNASRLSVSFQEEGIIMDLIEKLTFLTPAALGKETAQRPTARGTLAIIAQGEQKFGLLAARVQRIFTDLITMTRQYYEENMPEGLQERILGKQGNPVWGELSPEMIAGQFDSVMQLDLSAGDVAFEKQADQLIFQSMVNDPFVNQNPAFAWEIRADYLKSLGKKDIEKRIGPKPESETDEANIDDENEILTQEGTVLVKATDDDVAHMNKHLQYKRERGGRLVPNALRLLTEHILQHQTAHQTKLQQLAQVGGQQNAGSTNGQEGAAGLNQPSGVGKIQGPPVG